jgi:cytochrome P450
MSSVVAMEGFIQTVLDTFLSRMREHAHEVIDFSKYTNMFAFDVVGELAYGEDLGLLETDRDERGLIKTIFGMFYFMSNVGHLPGQSSWVGTPFAIKLQKWLLPPNPIVSFQDWTAEQIHKRRSNPSSRKDMLHHFLNMKNSNGGPATDKEVLMEALNIMLGPI